MTSQDFKSLSAFSVRCSGRSPIGYFDRSTDSAAGAAPKRGPQRRAASPSCRAHVGRRGKPGTDRASVRHRHRRRHRVHRGHVRRPAGHGRPGVGRQHDRRSVVPVAVRARPGVPRNVSETVSRAAASRKRRCESLRREKTLA